MSGLCKDDIDFYRKNGFLKVSNLFTNIEIDVLSHDMTKIIDSWGHETIGWAGEWRESYLVQEERENTKAVFIQNPHYYSVIWLRLFAHNPFVDALSSLIGECVQWHHTVLHAKPPEQGTPFPMHQDYPFYPHDSDNFVACLLLLDNAPVESGALMVVPGSHKEGPLEHITGETTAPYLPVDKYHPDLIESVPVTGVTGDVIFFSYYLIHWSDVNRTDQWRKIVRMGFHGENVKPLDFKGEYNNMIVSGFKSKI